MISAEEARRLVAKNEPETKDDYVIERIQEEARDGKFEYQTITHWISPQLLRELKEKGFKVKRVWFHPSSTVISWK